MFSGSSANVAANTMIVEAWREAVRSEYTLSRQAERKDHSFSATMARYPRRSRILMLSSFGWLRASYETLGLRPTCPITRTQKGLVSWENKETRCILVQPCSQSAPSGFLKCARRAIGWGQDSLKPCPRLVRGVFEFGVYFLREINCKGINDYWSRSSPLLIAAVRTALRFS